MQRKPFIARPRQRRNERKNRKKKKSSTNQTYVYSLVNALFGDSLNQKHFWISKRTTKEEKNMKEKFEEKKNYNKILKKKKQMP